MAVSSEERRIQVRGAHVDCRAQMLRFEKLIEIFDDLARWGYNAVLLEYEDHFPFRGQLARISAPDALTRRQVRDLDRAARSLGLEIIPLVHCLGHLTYALRVHPFRSFSEEFVSGGKPYTLCPSDPRGRKLFRDMAEQVLELHPESRYFHMGGDEARLNPKCPRCAERLQRRGVSEMLMEHYIDQAQWIRQQGVHPIIWADMALGHPERIEQLREHVILMDWDYWSGTKVQAVPHIVWGLPQLSVEHRRRPETWPAPHRSLFASYILTDDRKMARPFPYAKFLHDHGFQFMMAPAARSAGDSFCAPREPHHSENILGSVCAARAYRSLGCVVTSWALRRAPWSLTEYGLILGGLAMNKPGLSREDMDRAFAEEHFGVSDERLAEIPILLGTPVPNLLQALPEQDLETGRWPGEDYESRLVRDRKDRARNVERLDKLNRNLRRAEILLRSARPKTQRQKYRVALWHWAAETLSHFAGSGRRLLNETETLETKALRQFRSAAERLAEKTGRLLSDLYTDRTMLDEQQTRFGVQLDYFDCLQSK